VASQLLHEIFMEGQTALRWGRNFEKHLHRAPAVDPEQLDWDCRSSVAVALPDVSAVIESKRKAPSYLKAVQSSE
jgi:hypothetical protein